MRCFLTFVALVVVAYATLFIVVGQVGGTRAENIIVRLGGTVLAAAALYALTLIWIGG